MTNRDKATKIVEEIKSFNLDQYECAYIDRDGDFQVGRAGCQPPYTQAVGPDDFEAVCESEIIDAVEAHLDYYTN